MTDTNPAKRWTALRGWWWMPGMLTQPFHENGPDSPICHPPWRVVREGRGGPYANPANNDAPPDLDDPATIGCLVALTREITGCKLDLSDPFKGESWLLAYSDTGWQRYCGVSIPEALLLACEAAEAARGEK